MKTFRSRFKNSSDFFFQEKFVYRVASHTNIEFISQKKT